MQNAENLEMLARNNALEAEVKDLKKGKAAIEERARSELGMIQEGETFYQIIIPAKASPKNVSQPIKNAQYNAQE